MGGTRPARLERRRSRRTERKELWVHARGSQRTRRRAVMLLVAIAALGAVLAGSAFAAQAAPAPKVKKGLRLAFFSVGGNNTYLLSGMKGARDAAKKYGATIKVFDGRFDGGLQ